MKINSIQLTNFGIHESLLLNLPYKNTLIWGNNAKGKSTIIDAISFILTGTSSKFINQKDGLQYLVKRNKTNALVSINIDDNYEITRNIPHTLYIKGKKGSLKILEEELQKDFQLNKQQLLTCIYANTFTKLSQNEQKEFLFNILNIKINKEKFKEEFEIWCKENQISDSLFNRVWEFLLNKTQYFEYDNIKIFESINDYIKDENRNIKKEIKSIEEYLKNLKEPQSCNITPDKLPEMNNLLNDLSNQKNKLYRSLGIEEAKIKQIENLKSIIASKNTLIKPKKTSQTIKNNIKNIQNELSDIIKEIIEIETLIESKKNIIKKLENFNGKCALYSNIDCPLTKENLFNIVENENSIIKQKNIRYQELIENKKNKEENIKKFEFELNQTETYEEKIKEIEKALKEYKQLDNVNNIDSIKKEIETIENRIKNGEILISQIKELYSYKENFEQYKKKLEKLKIENENYNIILDMSKPSGIISNILFKEIKIFEKICNEFLEILSPGYKILFKIDDIFNIIIEHSNIKINYNSLSSSEKLRINLAITSAISYKIGLKILIMDDIEILIGENRNNLFKFIKTIENKFDSIILIAATEKCKNLNNWNMIKL